MIYRAGACEACSGVRDGLGKLLVYFSKTMAIDDADNIVYGDRSWDWLKEQVAHIQTHTHT